MRLLIIVLSGLLILLQYSLWFGKNGYLTYLEVQEKILVAQEENGKLAQRNQIIAAEIQALKEGLDAVEERARLNYEMIKPGEVFYRITKENK